jgi:hypothetical protein
VMSLYLASGALGCISVVMTRANLTEGVFISMLMLLVAAGFFVRFERMFESQSLRDAALKTAPI